MNPCISHTDHHDHTIGHVCEARNRKTDRILAEIDLTVDQQARAATVIASMNGNMLVDK